MTSVVRTKCPIWFYSTESGKRQSGLLHAGLLCFTEDGATSVGFISSGHLLRSVDRPDWEAYVFPENYEVVNPLQALAEQSE